MRRADKVTMRSVKIAGEDAEFDILDRQPSYGKVSTEGDEPRSHRASAKMEAQLDVYGLAFS